MRLNVMNSSRTQRALSLALVMLMVTSSVSFSMDLHLCQGHIKSVSLFGEAKACYPNEQLEHCGHQICTRDIDKHTSISKKPCCINDTLIFQSLEYQASLDLTKQDKPILPNLFGIIASRSFIQLDLSRCSFHQFYPHQPPLPQRNTIILFQHFLN